MKIQIDYTEYDQTQDGRSLTKRNADQPNTKQTRQK